MKSPVAFLPAAMTAVVVFAQQQSLGADYDGPNDKKAYLKNVFLISEDDFSLELDYFNKYDFMTKEYEFHGDLKLTLFTEATDVEIGFCIQIEDDDDRWDCFSNKISLEATVSGDFSPCQAIDSYRDGVAGKRRPDTASAFRNDKAKNWQALFDYNTSRCFSVAEDDFLDALTVTSSFERMFQTDGEDEDVQFSSTASEVKAIFGFVQFYDDADFTVASSDEVQGQIVSIEPFNLAQQEAIERQERDQSIKAGNYGEARLRVETGTYIPMDLKAADVDPEDLKMTIQTTVDEEAQELYLSLKVIGREIAAPGQQIFIYATIEDPEVPGTTETVACAITLSKSKAQPFVQAKNLWLMNYNGARSFKQGSDGVVDSQAKYLNEGDQVGAGKPWQTLMPEDGEDADKYYFTFWEYSTEKFEEQTCTFKRKLGLEDLGEIKVEPDTDYEVSVGVKLFYSKGSIGRQFEVDSKQPYIMNIAYTKADPQTDATENDSAQHLLVSLFATLALFALTF